jgi:ariadne-1
MAMVSIVIMDVLVSLDSAYCAFGTQVEPKLTIVDLPEFENEEQDAGFSQDKDIIKSPRRPYEVEFQVLGPSEIQKQQDVQIGEVASILMQPPEAAAILLRHLRWNKERLIEAYMDNPEDLLESAGLGPGAAQTPNTRVIPGFACDICCEDEKGLETYAMKCRHRYCVDCYRQYLAHKIKDEGEAARIQCPTAGCKRIVDSKSLDLLVAKDLKSRSVWLF